MPTRCAANLEPHALAAGASRCGHALGPIVPRHGTGMVGKRGDRDREDGGREVVHRFRSPRSYICESTCVLLRSRSAVDGQSTVSYWRQLTIAWR
jgi:hypothetical protein